MRSVLTLQPSYYEALRRLTLELVGVNLGSDHTFLIETRLSVLARKEGFEGLEDMVEELFSKGQSRLAIQAVSALLERDTHFFSDPQSYSQLENIIFPALYNSGQKDLRILSFGCSSGQEAYGIAICAHKLQDVLPGLQVNIVGVDYPSSALDRARTARYSHFDVQRGLPIRDLITYFESDGENWTVKPDIRSRVHFKDFHLLSNLEELGSYDVVLFRNNLPHYSSPALIRVFRGLSAVVKSQGYLVLGSEEELGHVNYGFDPVAGAKGVFYRREVKEEPVPEVLAEEDSHIKKPTGRKSFERSRRVTRSLVEEGKVSQKSA